LVRACELLRDRGVDFECVIAGSGPLETQLRDQIRAANLEPRVSLTGKPLNQEDIPDFMHGGDAYCLPCVWASDDDVDGLPQMLMEAMACGLPAISTRLVGIPDLVRHEETGLLVDPKRADEIADALVRLMTDRALAERLAQAGREHVISAFDLSNCLTPLIEQFRIYEAQARTASA
jgi:glycosyltransferase involved in cell wall biosynthesis